MFYFFLLITPAMLAVFISKYYLGKEITSKELLMAIVACLVSTVIATGIVNFNKYINIVDTEILNGYVTNKYSEKIPCEHSYQCNCITTCTGGKVSGCSTICQTCYEHSYDVDWIVETTVGNFKIDRVDTQGVNEPPRFSRVIVGEPASVEQSYMNYLKASKDSVFYQKQLELSKYKDLPKYPTVYDYYKSDKVINLTSNDYSNINTYLKEALKTLGVEKQLNILAVMTNEPEDYYDALLASFQGVKKNDVLLVYGVKGAKVKWFKSTSFADGMDNRELHVHLRQAAQDKDLDISLVKEQVHLIATEFNRLPNDKFEYLLDTLEPPMLVIVLMMVVNLAVSLTICHQLANNSEREY